MPPRKLADDLECQREELDRALIDAKLLEAEHPPPTTDAPRCCVVKVNVQGGVDVQVQVNVNALSGIAVSRPSQTPTRIA